jgi:hypothetical protein
VTRFAVCEVAPMRLDALRGVVVLDKSDRARRRKEEAQEPVIRSTKHFLKRTYQDSPESNSSKAREPKTHEPETHEPETHEPETHEPETHEPESVSVRGSPKASQSISTPNKTLSKKVTGKSDGNKVRVVVRFVILYKHPSSEGMEQKS